jgi:ribosome-binding factor A
MKTMMKRRMIRVNDEIKKELSRIFRAGLKDPRFGGMVSVVRVETSSDLKFCKVFVSILGTDEEKTGSMEAINSARGHLRSQVASAINMRQTPEFTFILDESLDHSDRINQLLDEV